MKYNSVIESNRSANNLLIAVINARESVFRHNKNFQRQPDKVELKKICFPIAEELASMLGHQLPRSSQYSPQTYFNNDLENILEKCHFHLDSVAKSESENTYKVRSKAILDILNHENNNGNYNNIGYVVKYDKNLEKYVKEAFEKFTEFVGNEKSCYKKQDIDVRGSRWPVDTWKKSTGASAERKDATFSFAEAIAGVRLNAKAHQDNAVNSRVQIEELVAQLISMGVRADMPHRASERQFASDGLRKELKKINSYFDHRPDLLRQRDRRTIVIQAMRNDTTKSQDAEVYESIKSVTQIVEHSVTNDKNIFDNMPEEWPKGWPIASRGLPEAAMDKSISGASSALSLSSEVPYTGSDNFNFGTAPLRDEAMDRILSSLYSVSRGSSSDNLNSALPSKRGAQQNSCNQPIKRLKTDRGDGASGCSSSEKHASNPHDELRVRLDSAITKMEEEIKNGSGNGRRELAAAYGARSRVRSRADRD